MSSLIDFLGDLWQWLKDFLLWLPLKIWELLTDGLAAIIEAIPVPDFLVGVEDMIADIPPEVAFFAAPFMLQQGIAMLLAALLIRFLIRRLPLVG